MRRYEIEYRRTPTDLTDDTADDWRRLETMPGEDEGSAVILDLDLGVEYDVRTRLVDEETGAFSEWVTQTALEVERDDGVPPDPWDLRLTKGDCITWEMPIEVLDLRGFLVRHAPGIHEGWERAETAHEGIVSHPPFLLCRVPKGHRTLLVRAVDWDGNESAEAVLVTNRGDIDDQGEFEDIRTVDESALLFPGTLSGATAGGTTLVAAAIPDPPFFTEDIEPTFSIDPDAPAFPQDDDASFFNQTWGTGSRGFPRSDTHDLWDSRYRWIEYVWSFTVHCGEEGPRSVMSIDCACDGEGWRLQYRVRDDLPQFPENPFEVAFPADANAEAFPTDSERRTWKPWPGRLLGVQPGRYDFRLVVPGGFEQATVSRLAVSLSSEVRTRHVTGLRVPALGGTRVSPGERWRRLVDVRLLPVGTATPTTVVMPHKSGASGPSVRTFQGETEATVLVDAVLRGY